MKVIGALPRRHSSVKNGFGSANESCLGSLPRKSIGALSQGSALRFLVLLICGDLAFIALHFINALTPLLNNSRLNLSVDRGYPEIYQYTKYLWIISILIFMSSKERSPHYVPWIFVFGYFLLDDSLQIHERIGAHIAASLNFAPLLGLRLQDYGELAISAAMGMVLLFPLLWAYKNGSRMFRKISHDLALLIAVLVFFGVAVDMVDSAIEFGWPVKFALGVIEDGGEMLAVSLIVWYAFQLALHDGVPAFSICDRALSVLTRRSA